MSNERKQTVTTPLARELSRELSREEIEQVAGSGGTPPGTIAFDSNYDPVGDRWLPY